MENFGLFELLDALSALTARGEDGTGAPQDAPRAAKTAPAGAKNADGAPPAREGPRAHSAPAAGERTGRAPRAGRGGIRRLFVPPRRIEQEDPPQKGVGRKRQGDPSASLRSVFGMTKGRKHSAETAHEPQRGEVPTQGEMPVSPFLSFRPTRGEMPACRSISTMRRTSPNGAKFASRGAPLRSSPPLPLPRPSFRTEPKASVRNPPPQGRKKTCPAGQVFCYLLENWGARRAFLRPYFLRSLTRGSRVKKPAFLSAGRVSGSACSSARAMPRRIAPA